MSRRDLPLRVQLDGVTVSAIDPGQTARLPARAGARYRLRREEESTSTGASAAAQPADAPGVLATRQGDDLQIQYTDGTQLVLESFFPECRRQACEIDLPDADAAMRLHGDSRATGQALYAYGPSAETGALLQAQGLSLQGLPGLRNDEGMLRFEPAQESRSSWLPALGLLGLGGGGGGGGGASPDRTAPTISLSSNQASLVAGETTTISFTLSEDSSDFNLSDVTVSGGSLSNFQGSGKNFTAVFTARVAGNASVSVASSRFSDAAGNVNTDGSEANNSLALTVLPAVIELSAMSAGSGGFVINGQSASDYSGVSVASAGDVNGDGLDDLIVGAYRSDYSIFVDAGRSYVVFGQTGTSAIDLSAVAAGTGGFVMNGESNNDWSGFQVASAGDLNGDGLADLIVNSYRSGASGLIQAGRSYVVFGKANTTAVDLANVAAGNGGFVINGEATGDNSGHSVSGAGDVNGDGIADLLVGAYLADPAGGLSAGKSYVVFGQAGTAAVNLTAVAGGTGGFVINGENTQDNSGFFVANAGDVNADGLADVFISAYRADPAGLTNAGRSYLVFGKTSTTAIDLSNVAAGLGGFVLNGESAQDESGYRLAGTGDVNGDGLADLIVGAYRNDSAAGTDAGRSYVVFGKTGTTAVNLSSVVAGNGGFVINGQNVDDKSGVSVASAGDINGDGLMDLIVGAQGADPASGGSEAGRSYVVFGKTGTAAVDLSDVANGVGGFVINGQSTGDNSGVSVAAAGDVNGDGLADLIVGAWYHDAAGITDAGRSYVIFGSTGSAFWHSSVDWLGTDGADTRSDGGSAQTLVAGAGNDSLSATAASVLYGGAGNDSFDINAAMVTALQSPMGSGGNVDQLARIDGGSGIDTVLLSGSSLVLDLTQVASQAASSPTGGSRMHSVEIFDITGSGNNTLKLTLADVLDLGSANLFATTGRQQLMVKGNAGDQVDLADGLNTTGWTQQGSATLSGASYQVWSHDTSLATVYIQSGLQVL